MRHAIAALLLALTLLPAFSTPVLSQAPSPPAAVPGDTAEDAKLKELFFDSDEANLRRNPILALYRGDLRYADHLGDYLSDAYVAGERAAAESDLRRLSLIRRSALTHVD